MTITFEKFVAARLPALMRYATVLAATPYDAQDIVQDGRAAPQPVPDRSGEVVGRDAIVRLIRTLPPRQRVVVALRYVEDLSDAEIATLLGISLGTVRSQVARALATLRQALLPTNPHTMEMR